MTAAVRAVRALLLGATCVALGSCQPGELLTSPALCQPATRVTVGPGVQPVIAWSPRCAVSEVWIEALSDSASGIIITQWGMYRETPTIRPPVRAAIDSTTWVSGPQEVFLTPGVAYKACLIDNERHFPYWAYLTCTEFTP